MATNAKDITAAHATHPGSVLKSELQARGIKQKDFAKVIGMPAPNLSELIKGKRHVTESIAIKLEEALGIPFQTWMNLQNRCHYVARRREELDAAEATAAREEQSLRLRLNLAEIYKYLGINALTATERVATLKHNLAIDLNELQAMEVNTVGYFKRSERLKIDETNMRTWLLLAWSEAAKAGISEAYTVEKGLVAAAEISQAANDGSLTTSMMKKTLNDNGIIFSHVPKLDAAPIDAYSVIVGEHPAIVVTYRYDDMDKLAFDVLHEIGHIVNHLTSGKSYIAVEHDYSAQSSEERQADEFANDMLIAPATWKSIMSARSKSLSPYAVVNTIAGEARRHGVSPTIAVARYKHDTRCYAIRGYRSPKIS